MRFEKYGKYWAVYDDSNLVCLTVYKKGAMEVVRRLEKVLPLSVSEPTHEYSKEPKVSTRKKRPPNHSSVLYRTR